MDMLTPRNPLTPEGCPYVYDHPQLLLRVCSGWPGIQVTVMAPKELE